MGKLLNSTIDFSSNFNGFGPPKNCLKIIKSNSDMFLNYAGGEPKKSIEAICTHMYIPKENIAWGNGTTQIFFTLPRVLPKGKTLIIAPTFWQYPLANKRLSQNKIEFYMTKEENLFQVNLEDLTNTINDVSVVYICNPNNPTSTFITKQALLSLIDSHPKTFFVVDETYLLFRENYVNETLTHSVKTLKNLCVVTSFSKFFSLPGLRMGFVTADANIIQEYQNFDIPYLHNPLVELLVPTLLQSDDYIYEVRNYYKSIRNIFYKDLREAAGDAMMIVPPEANFVLAKILINKSGKLIERELEKIGLIVRDASIYKGLNDQWIRFSIRGEKDNQVLIKNLVNVLNY